MAIVSLFFSCPFLPILTPSLPSLGVLMGWGGGSQSQVSPGAKGAFGETGFLVPPCLCHLPGDLFIEPALTGDYLNCFNYYIKMKWLSGEQWAPTSFVIVWPFAAFRVLSASFFFFLIHIMCIWLSILFLYKRYHTITLFSPLELVSFFSFFLAFFLLNKISLLSFHVWSVGKKYQSS